MIRRVEERLVYENAYVRIFDDLVAFPDGHEGTYLRSRWKAPYGVGLVPVAGRRVLLVNGFRYGEGDYSLEMPRGFGAAGRTPEAHALIELREETGLEAERLEPLFVLGAEYRTYIFIARLAANAEPSLAHQEATEDIAGFLWLEPEDLEPLRLAARGIHEPMTMAALLGARALL